jgi:hypothetical protein
VKEWSDEEVARRWWNLFPQRRNKDGSPAEPAETELNHLMADEKTLVELRARLSSVSWFMRCTSEVIARMANAEDECTGRFWEGRFKATVLSDEAAITACMDYVDLNPVRAGLVAGAEDYRWSGWGAALAGEKEAIAGLCDVVGCGMSQWESRGKGAYGSWVGERRKDQDQDEDAMGKGSLLRRVRAFSAGVAIGSAGFVEAVFGDRRELFGAKRKAGARPLARDGCRSGVLFTLRDLRG